MPSHDYSPREALDLLLRKVEARSPELASLLQSAIDVGKDVSEEAPSTGGRKKPRFYRKAVRLSDEEALRIATEGLRAHFVEQPLFTTSAVQEFKEAALGDRADSGRHLSSDKPALARFEGVRVEKQLEVELQTETQVLTADEPTVRLSSPAEDVLEQQKKNVERMFELFTFDEE